MNVNMTLKFAVSALAIGTTMVACKPAADASGIASASTRAPKAQQALNYYAKAQAQSRKGGYAAALPLAEQAVQLSPRDVGFRMLLADLYLKNGRFQSAETTFRDVLRLEPGNSRASLSIALARIALGRSGDAIDQLDAIAGSAPAADVGLAYALAGQPQRAIELLEPAARAPGANGRIRQNLALAYAIAGDWQKARTTAAQDVSPAELGARLQSWAALAQPSAPQHQVIALLGVAPAVDEGQPTRLALAEPQPQASAYAAADPAPAPAPEPAPVEAAALADSAPEAAPVAVAAAAPAPAPEPVRAAKVELPQWISERALAEASAPAPAPATPAEETRPVYAQAVQTLVTPQPSVLRRSASKVDVSAPIIAKPRKTAATVRPQSYAGPGRFAVQLGAFNSASGVERAWASAYKRFGFAGHTPLSTTVRVAGRGTFHRLAVAGFASHTDAARVCQSIRAKGGACFVRAVAGDAPVTWASRYAGTRRG
jgi:Flp pilus assembly protein TadD